MFYINIRDESRRRNQLRPLSFSSDSRHPNPRGRFSKLPLSPLLGMESLSLSHLIPSSVQGCFHRRWKSNFISYEDLPGDSLFLRRVKKQMPYSHIIPHSKGSVYQDFQDFAKPLHLLPASEVTTYFRHVPEEIIHAVELDQLSSFYMVELCTSRDFGSCLRDLNAAIMICLIDVNGSSILRRIYAVSLGHPGKEKDMLTSEYIHFQRGYVDTVTFKGPKLEKIEALWIGLESGSWRVDGVGLKVINGPTTSSTPNGRDWSYFSGLQYKFEANNIPLGDVGGLSVVELRPIEVTQLSNDKISAMSSINFSPATPPTHVVLSKLESMKEYADLKFSLLLYDLILVITGAAILLASSTDVDAYSFLAGGIGGFLYLLLLQRSVDGLSAPGDDKVEKSLKNSGVLNGPVMSFAFIIATIIVSSKYWNGGPIMVFSPSEVFFGFTGFLSCKIAVVLAALKPIQMSAKESESQ